MAEPQSNASANVEQLSPTAQNEMNERKTSLDARMEDANIDEAVKDEVDGAVASGPPRADPSTGGRVNVAETGDLHDLAERRRRSSQAKEA